MGHVALLGDSIFDNGAYTGGEPDVVWHLRAMLPDGWQATLLAVDGSTMSSIPAQCGRLPRDATHIVLAVGGNDALMQQDLLATRARPPMRWRCLRLASRGSSASTAPSSGL